MSMPLTLKKILQSIKNMQTETITNENGTAIKYPDGTLFQYGTINNNANGSPTLNFPVAFKDTNINIQLTNRYFSGGGATATQIILTAHHGTINNAIVYFRNTSGEVFTNTNALANWQAIGHWK